MNNDDRLLINIYKAEWFQTVTYCPRTLGQMKLFIEMVDKMKILKQYNLDLVVVMDNRRLNIIFALIKITNFFYHKFNYLLIKNILKPYYVRIFKIDKHSINMDQLIQDSSIIEYIMTVFPEIDSFNITEILLTNLRQSLKSDFFKKTSLSDSLSNISIFRELSDEIVTYTIKSVRDIHTTMGVFLLDVFNEDIEDNRIDQIIGLILNNMNFEKILYNQCTDIAMYNEYIINDITNTKNVSNIMEQEHIKFLELH